MALLITDEQVRQLLTMRQAIDACELAIKALQMGKAENRPRQQFYASSDVGTFMMRHFQGAIPELGVAGLRVTTDVMGTSNYKAQARPFGILLLFDLNSAGLVAVIHDHELQRVRVGAETGVAAHRLAREDTKTVGLLGSGYQAEAQLAAACAVRAIQQVNVYSPNSDHRSKFAHKMEQQLGVSIVPVASAQKAVTDKHLILASTNSSKPVLEGGWISEGAHVTSIVNSDRRYPRRELDNETFARSSVVVIGSLEQSKQDQATDIFEAVDKGALNWDRIFDLGEILTGERAGRKNSSQITLFKNNGLAVEFIALACKVYALARKAGAGEEIPAHYFPGLQASR